jgi:Protein of unknown function (DUF3352)
MSSVERTDKLRAVRRSIPLLLVVLLLVLAGCGSSSSGGPLGTELSYYPSSSPFVMSVQTDPQSTAVKNGQSLLGRFPNVPQVEAALMNRLQQFGINYQSDIRPLFGNPVSLGAAQEGLSGSARNAFLVVWVTKDAGKLSALIKKLGLRSAGSHSGATLYQSSSGTTSVAIDGATLVFAPSSSLVTAALDRHSNGGGFSNDQANKDLSGLPKGALIQAVGNLSSVLSTPRAAKARQIPWVAAIRGYGTAISASNSGLSFSYRVDTSGKKLSSSQLPLASGGSAPNYAGAGPIQIAMNNPAQVATFIEGAAQSENPASYARFQTRVASFRAKTGVDLNSLVKQLTGALAVSSDSRTTVARVGVNDPSATANALSKLANQGNPLGPGKGIVPIGGGFYINKQRKGVTVGVVGNQLVIGRAPVPVLRAFATAPTTPATGAQGSVAFRVSLSQLLQSRLKRRPPAIVQSILSSLGDYTGWVGATTSALTGNASLSLK